MRTPEIPHGTYLEISSPRKPGWAAENRHNPLREWDGRAHISQDRYRKSVALYKEARQAVLEELTGSSDESDGSRAAELGRRFGEAFNHLDGTRKPFIETEEREELFTALLAIVDDAEAEHGRTFDTIRQHLVDGVESVRHWLPTGLASRQRVRRVDFSVLPSRAMVMGSGGLTPSSRG